MLFIQIRFPSITEHNIEDIKSWYTIQWWSNKNHLQKFQVNKSIILLKIFYKVISWHIFNICLKLYKIDIFQCIKWGSKIFTGSLIIVVIIVLNWIKWKRKMMMLRRSICLYLTFIYFPCYLPLFIFFYICYQVEKNVITQTLKKKNLFKTH